METPNTHTHGHTRAAEPENDSQSSGTGACDNVIAVCPEWLAAEECKMIPCYNAAGSREGGAPMHSLVLQLPKGVCEDDECCTAKYNRLRCAGVVLQTCTCNGHAIPCPTEQSGECEDHVEYGEWGEYYRGRRADHGVAGVHIAAAGLVIAFVAIILATIAITYACRANRRASVARAVMAKNSAVPTVELMQFA